jgi:indole-3-acetate monooxygenase
MTPLKTSIERRDLLLAVDAMRDVLRAGSDEAERLGRLSPEMIRALDDSGVFSLQLPVVLGGAEADPIAQFEVIEAISEIDSTSGWCALIGATSIAWPALFLSDEAVGRIFANGGTPRAAGIFLPSGKATPVDGGYRVSGRWSYASGIKHAEWITAGTKVDRGNDVIERRMVTFPAHEAQIHDTWKVAGLQGTGSCDFTVEDLFVPEAFTWNGGTAEPLRGGALSRLGMPAYVMHLHAAFALGIARHAVNTIIDYAQTERAGYRPSSLISRPTFQCALGECELQLRAARALVIDLYQKAWKAVCNGGILTPAEQTELRGTAVLATQVAADVITRLFRYGGGGAILLSNALQRCLRDINAAAQHRMVSDSTYEHLGKFILGLPDANPNG